MTRAGVLRQSQNRALRSLLLSACALLTCAVSTPVHAFRLPVNFNQSAAIGGSGGRYFTGSPSDRYTCKVCHAEGGTPQITVTGLPVDGYIPGLVYPISIDWDDLLAAVAFNFEMTDGAGHALGTFSAPPPAEVPPAEKCSGNPALVIAAPERTLAILPSCGAHAATILWTAPPALVAVPGSSGATQAWFSGSVLASNEDGSVEGDGVADVSQVFEVAGQARPPATQITGSCSAAAAPNSSSGFGAVSAVGWIGGIAWRRRRRRTGPWR